MAASSARHILIVEDDGDLLEVLKSVLEDAGYRVSTAEGGAEAVALGGVVGPFGVLSVSSGSWPWKRM